MSKTSIKSKRGRARRQALIKRRLGIIAAGFVVVLIGSIMVLRMEALTLDRVQLKGATENREQIIAVAENILDDNFLFVLPKSSMILLPRRHISAELMRRFPRLLAAELDIATADNTLNITVRERERYGLWCRDGERGEQCFYIDQGGVVFSEAPTFSGSVMFIYRGGSIASSSSALGQRIMPEDEFHKIETFLAELAGIGFAPKGFAVEPFGYEILVSHSLRMLADRQNLAASPRNIRAAIRAGGLQTDGQFLKTLEYIDLRFENRIYYKYR